METHTHTHTRKMDREKIKHILTHDDVKTFSDNGTMNIIAKAGRK